MEKLKLKYEQFNNAFDRLTEALEMLENIVKSSGDEKVYRIVRDSLIKRFEFSSELFWKYVKRFLVVGMGQHIEFNTPKQVFRHACKAKLFTEIDTEQFIEMIMDRNRTSHIYKEEIADEIAKNIKTYASLIKKYITVLNPETV